MALITGLRIMRLCRTCTRLPSRMHVYMTVLVLFAPLFLFWPENDLNAQVFCRDTLSCDSAYGPGFSYGLARDILPRMVESTATGATLHAIQAVPLPNRAPETFGVGLQIGAAGGPADSGGDDSNPFLNTEPNTYFRNWPFYMEANGGSAASQIYAYAPASLVGLRSTDMVAAHLALHSFSAQDDTPFDVLEPTASTTAARVAATTASIGVRYSRTLLEPIGWEYLSYDGVRLNVGLSYFQNKSAIRSDLETTTFFATDSILAISNPNNFLSELLYNRRTLEYQTRIRTESKILTVPLELRTGFRLLFLSLSLGPGVAVNQGKHDVTVDIDGVVCSSYLGRCSSSTVIDRAVTDFGGLNSAGLQQYNNFNNSVNDFSLPPFHAYSRREVPADTLVPYFSADVRLHLGIDLILSGTVMRNAARVGLAVEASW
ncbi:MAG: hypothetical protein KDK30_08800 [Leptospiraceae bacterium]|nr:hypothetical protein [Leptospiraceae bacterium]